MSLKVEIFRQHGWNEAETKLPAADQEPGHLVFIPAADIPSTSLPLIRPGASLNLVSPLFAASLPKRTGAGVANSWLGGVATELT